MQQTEMNISDVFAYYQDEGLYYQYIPASLVNDINKKYDVPKEETILAFLHCGFKTGLCFTEQGVYWKLFGQAKGKSKGMFSWEYLKQIDYFKIENDYLYLNNEKVLMIAGTSYPRDALVRLFEEIKRKCFEQDGFLTLCPDAENDFSLNLNQLLRLCTTFKGNEDCLLCTLLNIDVKTSDSLSQKTRASLIKKLKIREEDTLIAYVNTYMGLGTNGVTITENGVFFSREFLSVFFPWHIYKQICFEYNHESSELLINDRL